MFILIHLTIFSTTYFVCHDGTGENSAHRRSLVSRLAPRPCQYQWAAAAIFWRLDLIPFAIFAYVSFTTSDKFFNNILCVPWWDRWNLSPQTEFGVLIYIACMCCLYLLLIISFRIRLQLTLIWLIVFVMQWSIYWLYCYVRNGVVFVYGSMILCFLLWGWTLTGCRRGPTSLM